MSNSTQNDIPKWSKRLQEAYDKGYEKGLADARKEMISKVESLPQYWDLDGDRLCVKRSDVLATLREEEQHG